MMTITDLRLEYCASEDVQYDNFMKEFDLHDPPPHVKWLEEQLLILKNKGLDYEQLEEEIAKRERDLEERERDLEE